MTSFGPETPTPFCVTSEKQLKETINTLFEDNQIRHHIKYNSGRWNALDFYDAIGYEHNFCMAINKYLDIDCTDQVLYIRAKGDEDPEENDKNINPNYKSNSLIKNWPMILEEKFCLYKKVDVCELSQTEVNETYSDPLGIQKVPNFKSNFVKCHNKSKKYDKIIMKNCLKFFDENQKYFSQFIMKYFKEQIQTKTSLLIIQRVCDLNTLPFHDQVRHDWKKNDAKYTKFMETIQNEFFLLDMTLNCLTI